MPRLSFIVPTYEEEGIARAIERLSEAATSVSRAGERPEILVVDDSAPAVRERLIAWAREWAFDEARPSVRVLEGPHRGKGAAVRVGALLSTGDVVFVVDADLPIPLSFLSDFVARIEAGADIVIGERPMARNAGEPVRFVLSRGLFAFQRLLVFRRRLFVDTQCGFKAFRGEVLRRLAAQQVVDGGMYDIEYLYVATLASLRVEGVPVIPNAEVRASKINVRRAMLQDPRDLLRVKWRALTGRYRAI